jgi:hypothetical protein
MPLSGSATVHQGVPSASRAGCQFQEKLWSGSEPVPWISNTGVTVAP